MIFVAIVFSTTWKGVGTKSGDTINQKSDEKIIGNIFDCDGDKFKMGIPERGFLFRKMTDVQSGILYSCIWESDNKIIMYEKGDSKLDIENVKKDFESQFVNNNNSSKFVKFSNGYETYFFDNDKGKFSGTKIIFGVDYSYVFGLDSDYEILPNDPSFRSFVDSFELVK
jgi:hypothetical protein